MSKQIKITLPDEIAEWIAALGSDTLSTNAASIIIKAYTQATQKPAKVNRWGGDRKSEAWIDQAQDIWEPGMGEYPQAK